MTVNKIKVVRVIFLFICGDIRAGNVGNTELDNNISSQWMNANAIYVDTNAASSLGARWRTQIVFGTHPSSRGFNTRVCTNTIFVMQRHWHSVFTQQCHSTRCDMLFVQKYCFCDTLADKCERALNEMKKAVWSSLFL
jgi:hypothetical protein